ncbi:MAG TPA: ABC transporter permease [Mizugakiibacter sp.]|nr:ABC transporter permease [Mizugakiibacter sp.]
MMGKSGLLAVMGWRNLWRNPRRTGLILVAVGIGVWSTLSFTALLQAWSASSLQTALIDMTGQGQIHARGYLDNPGVAHRMAPPRASLKALLKRPEVQQWASRVRVPAAIQSAYETMPVSLIGIDPAREQGLSFIATAVSAGQPLASADSPGILLGRELARRLRIKVGQRIVLMSQDANGALAERGFRVNGLFSATRQAEKRYVFVGIRQAQSMLDMGQSITGIAFDLHDINHLNSFLGQLRQVVPKLDVQSWESLRPVAKAVSQLSNSFILMWIFIIFVLMALGIVNTLLMSLHERVRELALLQALGLRPKLIFTQVMMESALVVLLGVVLGMVLAAVTVLAFHNGLNLGFLARGSEWLGAGQVLYPRLNISQFLGIGALIWVLGFTASLLPAWRIVHRVPIEAINRSPT